MSAAATADLRSVAELVRRESGVALREAQLPALATAIGRVRPGLSAGSLLEALAQGTERVELVERLIDEVTIKETFFFRHPAELLAIDWAMLLDGARREGRDAVRVWSAACASGEEPYTLAMLAADALAQSPPPVDLLATDIAHSALNRGREATYGPRSIRHVPDEAGRRWLERVPGGWRVTEGLRSCVRFSHHNLVRDPIPPTGEAGFDLIVCRNVFIYFRPEQVASTLGALERCLRPHGMLLLGAADRLAGPPPRFPRSPSRPRAGRGGSPTTGTGPGPRPTGGSPPRVGTPPGRAPASGPVGGTPLRARSDRPPDPVPRPVGIPPGGGPRAIGDLGADVPNAESFADRAERALALADTGRVEQAVAVADALLAEDPLDAGAHYARGLARLAAGDPAEAVADLRRALYLAPTLAAAAFALADAYEQRGDRSAARRSYAQTLRLLEHPDPELRMPVHVNPQDMAAACRARLGPDARELRRG